MRYIEQVTALKEQVLPFAADVVTRYPRWIITPDGDQGDEWCTDCGGAKLRNMRRRDRKRREDYILDGGWRTEEDGFRFCAGCGVRLDVSLTEYGFIDGLEKFDECGLSSSVADDAYEIAELLEYVEYQSDNEKPEVAQNRAAAITLAERFLANTPTNERTARG